MGKTATQIEQILATGASVTIDSKGKLSTQVERMAAIAKAKGGILTITNANKYLSTQLIKIGSIGGKHVHLIL